MAEESQYSVALSQMSHHSGFDSTSTSLGAQDDQSSTSIVTVLIAIILVVGIAVVISFLVLGGDTTEQEDSGIFQGGGGGGGGGGSGGGGGGVGGGGSPPSSTGPGGGLDPDKGVGVPSTTTGGGGHGKITRRPTPPPPPPPPTAPPSVTVIVVTPKPPPVPDELICTVGAFAVIDAMYPPDGLCDYLFYTHAVVYNKTELAGVEVNSSWTVFKTQIKARTKTAGGVSFDAKYVTAQAFDDQGLKKTLNTLASANVKNYGILNMVTSVKNWDDFMNRAKGAIEKLKAIQGNDSKRKIVMALGLFDYNEPNAWDKYRAGFRDAVEKTMADTVIAISSTSMVETTKKCHAAPTSVLDSLRLQDPARATSKSYPDLKTHAALVSANVIYNKNSTRLGLSMEMATLAYTLNATTDSLEQRAYHPCKTFYITSVDIVDCIGGLFDIEVLPGGMKFGSPYVGPDAVMTWEDEESLKYKFDGLKNSTNLREGLSWLLYNVHFGDFSKNCMDSPFTSVEIVKNYAKLRAT